MHRATSVRHTHDYCLWVEFDDGSAGEVDLAKRLFGPVFVPLADIAFFATATVDAFGVVAWPNGADIAPETLYSLAHGGRGEQAIGHP